MAGQKRFHRLRKQIRLVEEASFKITALTDTDVVRAVLGQLGKTLDGKPAAESTFARERATFHNFLAYMVEKKYLDANPLPNVTWTPTKNDSTVDRRRVVNEAKGRRLLIAASRRGAMGLHLRAYFGCLFLAGLRPGEAAALTIDELELPDDDDEPGWMHLTDSSPEVGGHWTDSGEREIRQLKHRAVNTVRPVPVSPLLCKLLRLHLEIFGTAPDGRLFRSETGGLVSDSTVNTTWDHAREDVLTTAELKSVQAERPYDLRHARLSIWLNLGIDAAQVSEWAGNSIAVLLSVYIHCLTDSQQTALVKLGWVRSKEKTEEDLSELDTLLLGEPQPSTPEPRSIYELAITYAEDKRKTVKADTMRGAIEALTKVVVATLNRRKAWPTDVQLGKALTTWALSDRAGTPPADLGEICDWMAENSPDAGVLRDPEVISQILDHLNRRLNGQPAARTVQARRKSALFNFLEYAIAQGHLPANPLLFRRWGEAV